MPDEFPTLEAVAALGVLALLLRTILVASEIRRLPRFVTEMVRTLAAGDRSAALAACNTPTAPALARSARELIALLGDPPYGPDAALDLKHEQGELEQDLTRRADSGRARDLIVLAVLLGAMTFAVLSSLLVSTWFHALAALASLLLIVGFVMRSRLRRVERVELGRIGEALARMLEVAHSPNSPRRSLHSIDGGCTAPDLFVAADHCNGATQHPSVFVINSGCQTALYFNDSLACSGTVSGGAHAFVGTCFNNLPCTATSLPGVIRCATGPDAGCLIDVCSSLSDPLCQ